MASELHGFSMLLGSRMTSSHNDRILSSSFCNGRVNMVHSNNAACDLRNTKSTQKKTTKRLLAVCTLADVADSLVVN